MSLGISADESSGGMDDSSAHTALYAVEAAIEAGEAVLSQRFGSEIRLEEAEDLAGTGPATVVRVRVASQSFDLPRTLVVKHYPAVPVETSTAGDPDPFAQEAVSYQLFTALSPQDRMCPELMAHDGSRRVLVIEDLGDLATLEDALHGRDPRTAEIALLSWARALGRLHATTAGREADFNALLRRLGAAARVEHESDPSSARDQLPGLLERMLGVSTPDDVCTTFEQAMERIANSSCRAFSPVQLWPDNNLVTDSGLRFLDFEMGRVRSALLDAGHLWAPFVSSADALALPAGMRESMVAAWRAEIQPVWPALHDDDAFAASLFDAQLQLVWLHTWRLLAGLETGVARLRAHRAAALRERWSRLAEQATAVGVEPVAGHAAAVASAIDGKFGPGLELPLYPAFRDHDSGH